MFTSPLVGHVGEAGVADVRVVLPHHRPRPRLREREQPVERLGHVPVADVPRLSLLSTIAR